MDLLALGKSRGMVAHPLVLTLVVRVVVAVTEVVVVVVAVCEGSQCWGTDATPLPEINIDFILALSFINAS